jgi:RNA polymerase sigma-70 factor (ECF subfamily)
MAARIGDKPSSLAISTPVALAVETDTTQPADPDTESAALPDAGALFRAHGPFVWRTLRHLGVPAADLDDACQEVFVVAHRRRTEVRATGSPRSWLFGVARLVALSLRQRRARRREELLEPGHASSEAASPEASASHREELARATAILAAMDVDVRMAFVLYEIEGMPVAEIAEAVACPAPTVYGRIRRAREIFVREAKRLRG